MNKEEHILSINFPLPSKLRNDSLKERKDMGEKRKLCELSHATPVEGRREGPAEALQAGVVGRRPLCFLLSSWLVANW